MLSYAAIDLTLHDPLLLERARAYLDPADVWAWCGLALPSRLRHLGWTPPRPQRVRPGVLVWPASCASRWAYLHAVASRERMEAVVQASHAASDGALPLVLNDGTRTLTTYMLLLPPRPLYDVPGAGGTFLLTLVDDRWRWWQVAERVAVEGGVTTWAELFEAVADALGITIAVDDIDADFLTPSSDLTSAYQALPPLLDAAARSVGCRLCRDADGTVSVLTATSSRTLETANLALLPRLAGGEIFRG